MTPQCVRHIRRALGANSQEYIEVYEFILDNTYEIGTFYPEGHVPPTDTLFTEYFKAVLAQEAHVNNLVEELDQ